MFNLNLEAIHVSSCELESIECQDSLILELNDASFAFLNFQFQLNKLNSKAKFFFFS